MATRVLKSTQNRLTDAKKPHMSREMALGSREAAVSIREANVLAREDVARLREEAVRGREDAVRVRAERDALTDHLREANEHLVLANLRAQALAEEASLLAAIVKSSDAAIFSETPDGIITSWNNGARRLYGYAADEIVGSSVSVLVPPDQAGELSAILERLTRGESTERCETVRIRKDGTSIPVALTVSPIKDETGRVVGACTIARDITDRKEAEQERSRLLDYEREARVAAETATRLKDEFLGAVSHELRTPLNAILGWTRMLTSKQLSEARATHALETVERNAASLAVIIADLLDVSRIVVGKLNVASQPVDLIAVTRAALDEIMPVASAKHVELRLSADPASVGAVEGDAGRLQQVIGNLLTNAVKFTPEGGHVAVSVARAGAQMEVKVVDTGRGIDADLLPHVFERFRQAESASTGQQGLGLGLAIVRQLVELQGGTVHAASEGTGRGATFTVRLPIHRVQASAERRPVFAERRSAASTTSPPLRVQRLDGVRVMVVDDDVDGRTLTALLLRQSGAIVNDVASVHEALEMLKVESPDVLVTDIGLPDEDGYALVRQIRQREVEHGGILPTIALTGYARVEDRTRALAAGFQGHVPKPVEPSELVAMIASLVQMDKASRKSSAAHGTRKKKDMKSSTRDRVEGRFHELKGKAKETAGRLADNSAPADEGQPEKLASKVQKKAGQVKKGSRSNRAQRATSRSARSRQRK